MIDPMSGAYTAGSTGSVTDIVNVVDGTGLRGSIKVAVGPGVTVTPSTASVAPRGTETFSVSGGSGTNYTWSLTANLSGGMISATGAYVAGGTAGLTDVVTVADALGNRGTASIGVSGGVSITPASAQVLTGGKISFAASGGTGMGYTWKLATNASGGVIDAQSGAYVAGATGLVTDVVQVDDSASNSATASIMVAQGASTVDAGTPMPDAGSMPTADSGTDDGGTSVDEAGAEGGLMPMNGTGTTPSNGCGCRTVGNGRGGLTALLGGLAALALVDRAPSPPSSSTRSSPRGRAGDGAPRLRTRLRLFFGFVKPAVGAREEMLDVGVLGALGERREADAHRGAEREARPLVVGLFHGAPESLAEEAEPVAVRAARDDREFLAPDAREQILVPHAVSDLRGDARDDRVPRSVAVDVVDALEMIDVEHDETQRRAGAPGVGNLGAEPVDEVAPVEGARHAVLRRRGVELLRVALLDRVEHRKAQPHVEPELHAGAARQLDARDALPSTNVPFADPRSSSTNVFALVRSMRACRRLTPASWKRTSHSAPRPSTVSRHSIGNTHPDCTPPNAVSTGRSRGGSGCVTNVAGPTRSPASVSSDASGTSGAVVAGRKPLASRRTGTGPDSSATSSRALIGMCTSRGELVARVRNAARRGQPAMGRWTGYTSRNKIVSAPPFNEGAGCVHVRT